MSAYFHITEWHIKRDDIYGTPQPWLISPISLVRWRSPLKLSASFIQQNPLDGNSEQDVIDIVTNGVNDFLRELCEVRQLESGLIVEEVYYCDVITNCVYGTRSCVHKHDSTRPNYYVTGEVEAILGAKQEKLNPLVCYKL